MGGYSLEGCGEREGRDQQGSPGKAECYTGRKGCGVMLVVVRSPWGQALAQKVGWSLDNWELFFLWSLPVFYVLSCLPTPSLKELAERQPSSRLGLDVPSYRSMPGTCAALMPFLHFFV